MSLLPKPQGGYRTIDSTPMWYRLWALARRKAIKEWEAKIVSSWVIAAPGMQALDAALRRSLLYEVASLLGAQHVAILWDYEKLFDTIDPAILLEESVALNFQFPIYVLCYKCTCCRHFHSVVPWEVYHCRLFLFYPTYKGVP